jgi:DNA-binding beta-propeller fold protein YncE
VLTSIPVGRFYPNVAPVFAVDEQTGHVYLGMDGPRRGTGMIGILDSGTGRLVRTVPMPFEVDIIAVDPRTARLFVAAESGTSIRVLDSHAGTLVRDVSVRPTTALAVDVAGNRVYAAGGGICLSGICPAAVHVLDTRSGALLHTITLHTTRGFTGWASLALDERAHRLVVARHISERYLLGTAIDVVDTTPQRLVRQTFLPGVAPLTFRSPVVDAPTGRTFVAVGTFSAGPPTPNAPLPTYSVVVFNTRTGRLVHTVPLGPGEVDLAVDERRGFVFATSFGLLRRAAIMDPRSGQVIQGVVPAGAGHLRVLDGHSGAILRTLAIGLATTSVAVDERQGRVYVANAGAVDKRSEYSGPGVLTIVDERNNWALHRVGLPANPMRLAAEVRTQRLVVASVGAYGKTGKGLGRVSILDSTRF